MVYWRKEFERRLSIKSLCIITVRPILKYLTRICQLLRYTAIQSLTFRKVNLLPLCINIFLSVGQKGPEQPALIPYEANTHPIELIAALFSLIYVCFNLTLSTLLQKSPEIVWLIFLNKPLIKIFHHS